MYLNVPIGYLTNIKGIFVMSFDYHDNICRDKGQKLYIGPWALAEDVDWSEDE